MIRQILWWIGWCAAVVATAVALYLFVVVMCCM